MLLSHENLNTIIYFSNHIHSETIRQCYQLPKYSYWYWKTPPVTDSLSFIRLLWHELLTRRYTGRCSWAFGGPAGACERCVPVVPSCRHCWFGGWWCWLTKWFPTYSLSITRRTPCRPSRFRACTCGISSFRRALISAGYCWNTAKSFLLLPFSNAAVGTF